MYLNSITVFICGAWVELEPTHVTYLNAVARNSAMEFVQLEPTHVMYLNTVNAFGEIEQGNLNRHM